MDLQEAMKRVSELCPKHKYELYDILCETRQEAYAKGSEEMMNAAKKSFERLRS